MQLEQILLQPSIKKNKKSKTPISLHSTQCHQQGATHLYLLILKQTTTNPFIGRSPRSTGVSRQQISRTYPSHAVTTYFFLPIY